MSFVAKAIFGGGSQPAPAPAQPEGPKTTMLDVTDAIKANVRRKQAPMTVADPTILGSDKLGAGTITGARY